MPFLQLPTSHMAVSHLFKGTAESSKMVPTLTENCFRQSRHFQIIRVLRNDNLLDSQPGHIGPEGHFALETVSKQNIGSEKHSMASIKPLFSLRLTVSMNQYYHSKSGVSK
jgi:hypothetical protein